MAQVGMRGVCHIFHSVQVWNLLLPKSFMQATDCCRLAQTSFDGRKCFFGLLRVA